MHTYTHYTWLCTSRYTLVCLYASRHICTMRVLGILPPGKFPPERSTPVYSPKEYSPPTLFRFVARFACVRIEDSSRNRFTSTAYFAQSQTTLFPCILFMGGMFRGGNNRGGTFRGGIFRSPIYAQLLVLVQFSNFISFWDIWFTKLKKLEEGQKLCLFE